MVCLMVSGKHKMMTNNKQDKGVDLSEFWKEILLLFMPAKPLHNSDTVSYILIIFIAQRFAEICDKQGGT